MAVGELPGLVDDPGLEDRLAGFVFGEAVDRHGVVVVPGVDDQLGDAVAVEVAQVGPLVLAELRVDQDMLFPEVAAGQAFRAGVFVPADFGIEEGAGDDVGPAVAVDVVCVLAVVGEVVRGLDLQLAQRALLLEVGAGIPEFAGGDDTAFIFRPAILLRIRRGQISPRYCSSLSRRRLSVRRGWSPKEPC